MKHLLTTPIAAAQITANSDGSGGSAPADFVVMLADDDDINRDVISKMLQVFKGVEIVAAEDGPTALQFCLDRRFDLLIVDLKMPVITGDKVIRHLRASHNPNTQTPVILCSAFTESELKRVVGSCPYDNLMGKPVAMGELRRIVSALTGRSL